MDILQGSGYSNKGIGENKQESRGKRSQVKIAGVVASYSTNKLIRLNGLIIRGLRGVLSRSGIPRKITVRVERGFAGEEYSPAVKRDKRNENRIRLKNYR